MLFTSYIYILFFLPISLLLYFKLSKHFTSKLALQFLIFVSLGFYAYWKPEYLSLIILSTIINYLIGVCLIKRKHRYLSAKQLLVIGITVNLLCLGYFKYINFIVENISMLTGYEIKIKQVILPLAISFFTFQQIAYLVDAYRGEIKDCDFTYYCQFVTFFPQLIAGPIVHHKEIIPQLNNPQIYKPDINNITIGMTLFFIGLFKKLVIADSLAPLANDIFSAADAGKNISLGDAWMAACAYTFQLYFDFSGYADMAIGSAKLFGINLPINFNSPYKANNIIDFWRRWHITLSRFLKDYLYIPLGGNRHGQLRRNINLMITMLLGGLWHGAGWTFIIWGGLHGFYLLINHSFQYARRHWLNHDLAKTSFIGTLFAKAITIIAVMIAWIFFRAETLSGAVNILTSMFDVHQIYALSSIESMGEKYKILQSMSPLEIVNNSYSLIILLFCIVLIAPNTNKIEIYVNIANKLTRRYWSEFCYRLPQRMLISYVIIITALSSIYYSQIDLYLYRKLPLRTNISFVDNKKSDLRSNIFINNIFQGDEKKIILAGSSFTGHSGSFFFEKDNVKYKVGSLGMGGNFINNGIRLAVTAIDTPNLDTLILGISPLNMRPMKLWPPFKYHAVGAINATGFDFKVKKHFESKPSGLDFYRHLLLYLNPSHTDFAQIHGFLHNIYSRYGKRYHTTRLPILSLSREDIDKYYNELAVQKSHATLPVKNQTMASNTKFNWSKRGEFKTISPGGDIYNALKSLKKMCDDRNIHFVVYDTPTVSHEEAPHIYPEGYLEKYRQLVRHTMNELNIEYYDLINFYPWKGEFMGDFIHPHKAARVNVTKHLMYSLYVNHEENNSIN